MMGRSLREMRGSPDLGLPEDTYPVCLARKLEAQRERIAADLADLTAEQDDLEDERERLRPSDSESRSSAARIGSPDDDRVDEIDARLVEIKADRERLSADDADVLERMAEHTGDVGLRAIESGEWQQWLNAHPPRDPEEERARYQRDLVYASGICDSDALIADLHRWVVSWDGEPLAQGDYEFIAENAANGSKRGLARRVLTLQEEESPAPKSRRGSSTIPSGSPD